MDLSRKSCSLSYAQQGCDLPTLHKTKISLFKFLTFKKLRNIMMHQKYLLFFSVYNIMLISKAKSLVLVHEANLGKYIISICFCTRLWSKYLCVCEHFWKTQLSSFMMIWKNVHSCLAEHTCQKVQMDFKMVQTLRTIIGVQRRQRLNSMDS